jgi:hypothetical protein
VQHDVVLVERVPAIAGHARERTLEGAVVEGLDLAARAADEVMVVLAPGKRRLEPAHAIGEVDAMNESQGGELVEDSIHGRDADGRPLGAKAVV